MSQTVRTKNAHQQAVVKMMNRLSQQHSARKVNKTSEPELLEGDAGQLTLF